MPQIIQGCFNFQELRALCFELDVNYEVLGENLGLLDRIVALINYMIREKRIDDLIDELKRKRPLEDWPEVPTNIYSKNAISPVAVSRERQNELALLHKVRKFWIESVLDQSLHGTRSIEPRKSVDSTSIDNRHPWSMVLEIHTKSPQPIAENSHVINVYDALGKESDRTLLILGEPGSGKTITLLKLAQVTLERAEHDPNHNLPVVFHLSSWADRELPLADWLVGELNARYLIPKKIGLRWVENNQLLLLLDGLDEIRSASREKCVKAINVFHQTHGLTPIVVCSRTSEYESIETRLKFESAIRLLPLTTDQINHYLDFIDAPSSGLREALSKDNNLRELAQTPLMLSIMSTVYKDVQPDELLLSNQTKSSATASHLFDAYVARMFKHRRGDNWRYKPEQFVIWLSWLAKNMAEHSLSVFSIEHLQPSWLKNLSQLWLYVLFSRVIGVFLLGFVASVVNTSTAIVFLLNCNDHKSVTLLGQRC